MKNILVNLSQQPGINSTDSTDEKNIFVIVHGADGSIAPFYALATLLNVTVIAIPYLPAVVGDCQSIEAFAEIYLDELHHCFPDSSYVFAGHSYGGLVAYEMAVLAKARERKKIPVFLIDPNLPLAMRNYQAERLLELRVLVTTVIQHKMVEQYDVHHCDESSLFELLKRCLKPERIEAILSARRHCLKALSRYIYTPDRELSTHVIHAGEKLGFDFIDEETKQINHGITVSGNHFTMLDSEHVKNIARIIHTTLEPPYE